MAEESHGTVLIVDDWLENVNLLSRILAQQGYTIQTAINGAQALDCAQKFPPDIILLDINLPGMDGFETCRCLKKDDRTRDLPVIFISAMESIEDKIKALKSGGIDYIPKPFDYQEVQARVKAHLDILRLRIQLQAANKELSVRLDELSRSQDFLCMRELKMVAFINVLPSLAFILDEEGRYIEIIANETSFLRADADKLMGRLLTEFIPAPAATLMLDTIRKSIDTGKTQVVEYHIPVQAGGERWFKGRVALLEKSTHKQSTVVFIAADITERVHLYEEVQRLADQDPLTACFNRRHFMSLAEIEVQRAIRYQRPRSLVMMDIDGFKKFNDQFGLRWVTKYCAHL
jgi:two-component system, cell cycle response regulator